MYTGLDPVYLRDYLQNDHGTKKSAKVGETSKNPIRRLTCSLFCIGIIIFVFYSTRITLQKLVSDFTW